MPHAGGRPTDYSPELLPVIGKLSSLSLTMDQIAGVLEVERSTLYNWITKHPEILDSIKSNRKIEDGKVVRSLYERATGYVHEDTHISNYQGEITETPILKHYPPDPVSMLFWLKNRQPEEWRDRQQIEIVQQIDGIINAVTKVVKEFVPKDKQVECISKIGDAINAK